MFQWTEGEVSHVVKLALESLRDASQSFTASHRSRLIAALASELSASAWQAHTIDAQSFEAESNALDSNAVDSNAVDSNAAYSNEIGSDAFESNATAAIQTKPIESGTVRRRRHLPWRTIASAPEPDASETCLVERYAARLLRLLDQARASGTAAEETIHRSIDVPAAREQPLDQSQHALVWLAVRPEGTCACVEFLKRPGDGPFTMRDEAVLRILSPELLAQPVCADGRSAGSSFAPEVNGQVASVAEPPEIGERTELPRRQREVLARLLIGASVKEIASDLGISPYTVNDYIKALYRRYHVSSRGELMAAVHGLRRPAVPK